jgi:DNA-binding TFAR19-related protein (PDSD5 family)
MAIGEFLGQFAGAATGSQAGRDFLTLAGRGYDAFSANQNARAAEAERRMSIAQQQQLIRAQLEQEAQDRAERVAMRDRLLQQSSNLSMALQQAYQHLGLPYQVDPEQITRDYMAIREQNHGDLSRLVELTASRVHANDIERGMDRSTLGRDNQAEVFRRFAPEFQKADQAAYDSAINRANAMRGAISGSRDAMLGELGKVYGTQFDMERQLMPGATPSSGGASAYGDIIRSQTDTVRGANQAAAASMGKLNEQTLFDNFFNRRNSGAGTGSTVTGTL